MDNKIKNNKKSRQIMAGFLGAVLLFLMVFLWAFLFASGNSEKVSSVEANLFSLMDFERGAMLSASCDAAWDAMWPGDCNWSACSASGCGESGTQNCDYTADSDYNFYCRGEGDDGWAYYTHSDAADTDHIKDCTNSLCVCGTANNKVYALGEPFKGTFTLCATGSPNPASPVLNNTSGATVSWSCSSGGTSSPCSASRAVAAPCNLPWGGTTPSGTNITAYQNPTVPCGSTCESQIRICNNGVLSGSYTNESCSVSACAGCITSNACAASTCIGETCMDSCDGTVYPGTRDCYWREVAP